RLTIRVKLDDSPGILGMVTGAIGAAGGMVGAVDLVEVDGSHSLRDIVVDASGRDHWDEILAAIEALEGAEVIDTTDRTFLLHVGGKIEQHNKHPLKTRDDLSMAYTPGVARISMAIAKDPSAARKLTIKRNTVAVVTDGSAVLGLGNIGPEAALPVMEGKALLFKRFAGIDAWPVCLATQDVDEIVRIVQCIAPVYGGINLEDISAPRCFEIERRLRDLLDIPVFHDDQHGTAIVVFAALINALRVVGKEMKDARVVVLGVGAAGVAISKLLLKEGVGDVIGVNRGGIIAADDERLDTERRWLATHTNKEKRTGPLSDAMAGADVFIGVSGPNLVSEDELKLMAPGSIVFALANPEPEVDPVLARRYAAVVATGRSDEPNQINNVLAFPGIFRGMLNAGAKQVTEEIEIAAARAIADVVTPGELSADYIVPTVFNPLVVTAVTSAVEKLVGQTR
ncbi:MAG TPA: NAD-dependent malic enzyme, partial [Acidimicrobiales bacterium]|nr:NAD-dependent malic enzyme [Acidimicrobiales bacterium]